MITTQTEFRAALFDPGKAVPTGLQDGQARAAGKRFDVYRNNVIMSLKEAMAESFPVIERLIGPRTFANLSGLYVRQHPPADPRMMLYGAEFPGFLEGFEPLAHLPYLADVARLELAQRYAYHAADTEPVDPAIFGRLSPEDLAAAQLRFAPALHVLRSPWPILDIWHFNMTEGAPQPRSGSRDVLVTRAGFDPELHLLPADAADLLGNLQAGTPLGAALEALESQHPEFDFPAFLGLLLQTGAITALDLAD